MKITKHKNDCAMAFSKKDPTCPRCQELLSGAEPRSGWQKSYYEKKAKDEAQRKWAIENHNCVESKCGAVCTAFEW